MVAGCRIFGLKLAVGRVRAVEEHRLAFRGNDLLGHRCRQFAVRFRIASTAARRENDPAEDKHHDLALRNNRFGFLAVAVPHLRYRSFCPVMVCLIWREVPMASLWGLSGRRVGTTPVLFRRDMSSSTTVVVLSPVPVGILCCRLPRSYAV